MTAGGRRKAASTPEMSPAFRTLHRRLFGYPVPAAPQPVATDEEMKAAKKRKAQRAARKTQRRNAK